MKDILCLYYTRTGSTKTLMQGIAEKLDAELAEYTDGKNRSGILGYLGSCVDAIASKQSTITISQTERPLSDYAHVVIAMPIWVEGASIVGKNLIKQYKDQLPENVHLVITHMAPLDYARAFVQLDKLLNTPHKSHLSVSTKKGDYTAAINAFIEGIKAE